MMIEGRRCGDGRIDESGGKEKKEARVSSLVEVINAVALPGDESGQDGSNKEGQEGQRAEASSVEDSPVAVELFRGGTEGLRSE